MTSWTRLAGVVLVAIPSAVLASISVQDPIEGRYRDQADRTRIIIITRLSSDVIRIEGAGWQGVGLQSGARYWGVFSEGHGETAPLDTSGTHWLEIRSDGTVAVRGEYTSGRTGTFKAVWIPERQAPPRRPADRVVVVTPPPTKAPEPGADRSPELGEYVYVEELPEAISKVPPVYPEAARPADGTVLIQALVGKDGRVRDTRVVKSIPGLDDAAVAAVRQWVFKPAMAKGSPVEVWVAVPVRFTPP